jgi:hypothetical protein
VQLSNINDVLRRKLSVQSVQDVDGFPCSNYAEFLQRQEEGHLEVLTGYDSAVLPALGTSGARHALRAHLEPRLDRRRAHRTVSHLVELLAPNRNPAGVSWILVF